MSLESKSVSFNPPKTGRGKQYDCEAIAKDYTQGELSLSEVMEKHDIASWSTVITILDNMGVERRSVSEGVRLWYKKRGQRYAEK